jgi:flavodoxin
MKKFAMWILYIAASVLLLWGILTIVAQMKGKPKAWVYKKAGASQKALIVYNPDIFYNLDEQVCKAFAEEIKNMQVTVATVAAADTLSEYNYDLYIFCANTYNWRPDWPTAGFIKNYPNLQNKPVVAITLGSGSTEASQKHFENIIHKTGAKLIASRSSWLLKPNDESRTKEKNVAVAISLVHKWAKEIMVKLSE